MTYQLYKDEGLNLEAMQVKYIDSPVILDIKTSDINSINKQSHLLIISTNDGKVHLIDRKDQFVEMGCYSEEIKTTELSIFFE
jgi:GTP1/Obg family GTP-binding protein